jgi:hypothetical protein
MFFEIYPGYDQLLFDFGPEAACFRGGVVDDNKDSLGHSGQ